MFPELLLWRTEMLLFNAAKSWNRNKSLLEQNAASLLRGADLCDIFHCPCTTHWNLQAGVDLRYYLFPLLYKSLAAEALSHLTMHRLFYFIF